MKNVLETYENRANHMEEGISELEDRNLEMIQVEEEMLRWKKKKKRERDPMRAIPPQ